MPKLYELTPRKSLSFTDVPDLKCEAGEVKVYFYPLAFAKMAALIERQEKEVAWHGLVSRKATYVYAIEDILVYPQAVTGGTVETDQIAYQDWLMGLETEMFSKVRMQGHSHVRMSPVPSGRDAEHQTKIVEMLEDGMFYIFMIWNKEFNFNVFVYDASESLVYYGKDVHVDILSPNGRPSGFPFNEQKVHRFVERMKSKTRSFYSDAVSLIKDPAAADSPPGNSSKKSRKKFAGKPGIGAGII